MWLKGELDVEALRKTINTMVERHESLRTHFEEVGGEPVQVIERELRIEVPVVDLRGEAEQQEQVRAAMREEASKAFDLGTGPLLRMKLLKLGEQEHVLLRTMPHIVSDGWSQGVYNREFMVLYEAYAEGRENPLEPLRAQYADFALGAAGDEAHPDGTVLRSRRAGPVRFGSACVRAGGEGRVYLAV